jgi:GNAT superfamily N-acetyltransferase
VKQPNLTRYRDLYYRVGKDYLWASRLLLDDGALAAILHDPALGVYVLRADGRDAGILELDFRISRACELVFFGVERALLGRGAGRWLMNRAVALAWSAPIERFWVHTCTLDHPSAPEFYVRSGFTPYRRQIEIFADPRVLGILPRDAAPDVPIL